MKIPQKLKIDSAISLGMYLRESKAAFFRDTCTLMFFTALFTLVKLWNQPRYSSIDKQTKNM
jgi:hypothetical protein